MLFRSNTSEETVTITSLSDSVFGTLAGDDDCKVGTELAAGEEKEFSFTQWVEGDYSGPDHVNTFTAKAIDNDKSETTDDDDATVDFTNVLPTILVTKNANPTAVPETGGDVLFTFKVKNTSSEESVTITSLFDSVFGTLAGDVNCKVGTVLTAGEEQSFSFTKWTEGDYSGPDHVNTFTAKAVDNDKSEATDDDDATVDFTNVLPTIEVTKTANPTVVPETGGDVLFTFKVKNTSSEESVTITGLSDSVFGTLAGDDDCKVGTELAAGEEQSFSFTKWVEGDYSGLDHENTFTAKAVDNDKSEATDDDDALVDFSDYVPKPEDLEVTKTVDPIERLEPGGTFKYLITVKNVGPEPLILGKVEDDKLGVLYNPGAIPPDPPITLKPGESTQFIKVQEHHHAIEITNIVTAIAADNEGNSTGNRTATATIKVIDVKPVIEVTKTPYRTQVPAPSAWVNYTFKVTNKSVEPVKLTSLVDDKLGDLSSAAGLPKTLAVGATFTFTKGFVIEGDVDTPHVNTVTATANDDENNTANA